VPGIRRTTASTSPEGRLEKTQPQEGSHGSGRNTPATPAVIVPGKTAVDDRRKTSLTENYSTDKSVISHIGEAKNLTTPKTPENLGNGGPEGNIRKGKGDRAC